jgi:hypothetical protein
VKEWRKGGEFLEMCPGSAERQADGLRCKRWERGRKES